MAYSFPKFSFLIGLAIIGLIASQSFLPQVVFKFDEKELNQSVQKSVISEMCTGKDVPVIFKMIEENVKGFNSTIALIVCLSAIALTLSFMLLPQNGCFMWFFVHLLTAIFIVVAFAAGYYIYIGNSTECLAFKTIFQTEGFSKISFDAIMKNPQVAGLIAKIPEAIIAKFQSFKTIFFQTVEKLGVTAPIFVIVIAFYLINEQTAKVTKTQILFLISFIVCVITGVNFYAASHDIVYTIAFSVIFIILAVIIINLAIHIGYLFVAPKFLFSCFVIAYRILNVLNVFKVPFSFLIACGIFIFLFANVFIWTKNGSYLTVIFLLNYGLSILYPLPAESLVVLVFMVQMFMGSEEKKQQIPEVPEKKEKQD